MPSCHGGTRRADPFKPMARPVHGGTTRRDRTLHRRYTYAYVVVPAPRVLGDRTLFPARRRRRCGVGAPATPCKF